FCRRLCPTGRAIDRQIVGGNRLARRRGRVPEGMTMEQEGDPRLRQLMAELEAARFISKSGAILAEVTDYESTLERIANLAVPGFADWFGVHIRERDGAIRRLAVRHADPLKREMVAQMYRRYPPAE